MKLERTTNNMGGISFTPVDKNGFPLAIGDQPNEITQNQVDSLHEFIASAYAEWVSANLIS